MAPFLHLAHVNVARGNNVVLHDINLSVNTGEHIAILGPNGCGKSTLIKTITCECYPIAQPETQVSIFGRERWDLTELKKRLGVVSAELPGKQTLTTSGRDAVLTGFFSSSTLWPNLTVTDAMRTRADEVLHQIDALPLANKPVGEMSAGQQRRIMIGRALVASSQMLLLDEPSNALDLAAQADHHRPVFRQRSARQLRTKCPNGNQRNDLAEPMRRFHAANRHHDHHLYSVPGGAVRAGQLPAARHHEMQLASTISDCR